jgi:hypothetical protein
VTDQNQRPEVSRAVQSLFVEYLVQAVDGGDLMNLVECHLADEVTGVSDLLPGNLQLQIRKIGYGGGRKVTEQTRAYRRAAKSFSDRSGHDSAGFRVCIIF